MSEVAERRAMNTSEQAVRARVREALLRLYGPRLERAVLFGSRARGDARSGSDYDVAVFPRDMPDRWAELDRLADLRVTLLDETGAFLDARPYSAAARDQAGPLMGEIRREGITL